MQRVTSCHINHYCKYSLTGPNYHFKVSHNGHHDMGTRGAFSLNQNNLRGWFLAMTANSADEMNVTPQQPGSTKNESSCPLGRKICHRYPANATCPTWRTGRTGAGLATLSCNQSKQDERASDHYVRKSDISKAVNHCKSSQLTASHPTNRQNILVIVFLFKCKLSIFLSLQRACGQGDCFN